MALNPLVSLFGRLVARSGRKRGNRQTDGVVCLEEANLLIKGNILYSPYSDPLRKLEAREDPLRRLEAREDPLRKLEAREDPLRKLEAREDPLMTLEAW